jgi:hypothetical protein
MHASQAHMRGADPSQDFNMHQPAKHVETQFNPPDQYGNDPNYAAQSLVDAYYPQDFEDATPFENLLYLANNDFSFFGA